MKIAFGKLCVTLCERFLPDEGIVAGYADRIGDKSPAKWDVQLAGMNFHIHSGSVATERFAHRDLRPPALSHPLPSFSISIPQFQCKKGPRNPRQAFFLFSSYSRMLYICFAFFFIFILTLGTNILHYVPSCDNTYKILLVVNNRYKILPHSLVQQIFHVGIHTDRRIVGPALELSLIHI